MRRRAQTKKRRRYLARQRRRLGMMPMTGYYAEQTDAAKERRKVRDHERGITKLFRLLGLIQD